MEFRAAAQNSLDDILRTDAGFLAWNYPLAAAVNNGALTSQRIAVAAIGLRAGQVVTNVCVQVQTAAVGTAPTNAFAGLATKAGVMVAQTADIKANAGWSAIGIAPFPLSATYTVPTSGLYYVAVLVNGSWGTTQPSLGRAVNLAVAASKISGGTQLWGDGGTAQSALPANASSLTLGTSETQTFWVAVS